MQNRNLGWALFALGLAIALLAFFRDAVFPGPSAGFGFQQTVGVLIGLAVAVVGWLMARKG